MVLDHAKHSNPGFRLPRLPGDRCASGICPHNGGSLAQGVVTGLLQSTTPGDYSYTRQGEIIRCPWHGWEFDIKTGRSFCTGIHARARPYPVTVEPGSAVAEGPYRAETIPVRIEEDYVVVDA